MLTSFSAVCEGHTLSFLFIPWNFFVAYSFLDDTTLHYITSVLAMSLPIFTCVTVSIPIRQNENETQMSWVAKPGSILSAMKSFNLTGLLSLHRGTISHLRLQNEVYDYLIISSKLFIKCYTQLTSIFLHNWPFPKHMEWHPRKNRRVPSYMFGIWSVVWGEKRREKS